MSKISLSTVSSGFLSNTTMTLNFTAIQDEFQNKVLYRNNPAGEPNSMLVDLDMDSHRVLNLPEPLSDNEPARLKDVQNALAGATNANLISYTPSGTISSNNVQAAINELASEKAQLTDLAASTGATLVGGKKSGIATVVKKLSFLMDDSESIFNWLTDAEVADVQAGTELYDLTSKFNAATLVAKRIHCPAGTYIVDGALLRSKVELYGDGELTIFKAKAGSNNAVFITENFATLQTTYAQIGGSGPTYKSRLGSSDFNYHDFIVHGNYIPTISSGGVVTAVTTNASVDGIKIYGCNYKLNNITVIGCRYTGIYSEWSEAGSRGTGGTELESQCTNIKVLYCGRSGIDWRGPHDSIFVNPNVAWCNLNYLLNGTEGDFPAIITQNAANVGTAGGNTAAGTTIRDPHIWGNSHTVGMDLLAVTWVRDGYFEQAKNAQIRLRSHGCIVAGDAIIASGQAVKTGQIGVQIANDAMSGTPARNNIVRAYFAGLPTSVDFQSSGGQNLVEINGYGENSSANAYTGTPNVLDEIDVNFAQDNCIVASHLTVRTKFETVAWGVLNTATGAWVESEGLGSVTRYSAGLMNIAFGRDAGSTRYAIKVTIGQAGASNPTFGLMPTVFNKLSTGFNISIFNASAVATDCTELHIEVVADRTKFK